MKNRKHFTEVHRFISNILKGYLKVVFEQKCVKVKYIFEKALTELEIGH